MFKIFCYAVCLLLMMTVVAGCSQSPQGEEQKVSQPVLAPIEGLSLGTPEKQIVSEEQETEDNFTIQVAAFHGLPRAEGLVETLKADGYRAYVSPEDLEKQERWYRVFVGNFTTKEEAKVQLPKLKDKFDDSFIRLR